MEAQAQKESLIKIENMSVLYGKDEKSTLALKDINLEIKKSEFIGLAGHTGSGKSTLVQLFNALIKDYNPETKEVSFGPLLKPMLHHLIHSYGLQVRGEAVEELMYRDTLETEPNPILNKDLKTEKMFFRDANWSPDWKISAQNINYIYKQIIKS